MKLRISEREGEILSHAQLHAGESYRSLAKRIKLREHIVRDSIRRLISKGAIQQTPLIDAAKLGYSQYHIFLSLAPDATLRTNEILSSLKKQNGVVFIAELSGRYQYELMLLAKSPQEVSVIFEALSEIFPRFIENKAVASCLGFSIFPKKYLMRKVTLEVIKFMGRQEANTIDAMDSKIITSMISSPGISLQEISRAIRTPATTVQYRIKGLEQKGIIAGYIYDTEPLAFGVSDYKLLLRTKDFSHQIRDEIYRYALAHRHITALVECFGDWDFEIVAEFPVAAGVVTLQREILTKFGKHISSIEVMERFSGVYFNMFPFLP